VDESPCVLVVEPCWVKGTWQFDDPYIGLHREPSISAVNSLVDRLSAAIPDAHRGFRLILSTRPFEGCQSFSWVRSDSVEGNWFRADETGEECWVYPASFDDWHSGPLRLYARAEPKLQRPAEPGAVADPAT